MSSTESELSQANKALVTSLYDALDSVDSASVADVLGRYYSDDCQWYGVYPFGEQRGAQAIAATFWEPLLAAWGSVQRRQDILLAGVSETDGKQWVASMGHLVGLYDGAWLGVAGHRKLAMLRYAEFFCIEAGQITRSALFCDILGVLQQLGINPLPTQTGAALVCPGPRSRDGMQFEAQAPAESAKTLALINQLIADLDQLNKTGDDRYSPDVLRKTWHEDMTWYGPAGIGTTYTIPRYLEQHSYPFREGLADKRYLGHICRFAEGSYAGFFGWPNLTHEPTGGFLGLPAGPRCEMRVVDIYRREGDKLAENWVFIDLLWWLKQQGIDVLERARETHEAQRANH